MSIRVQIAKEKLEHYQDKLSKCSENQIEEIKRLQSCIDYCRRIIQEPQAAATRAWTLITNILNSTLKSLAETDPIQVVSICDKIEKFLIEEGIITEDDIRIML